MNRKTTIFMLPLCLLTWLGGSVQAQNLLGSNPVLPQIHARTLAWADYDGDGDVDLLMGGRSTLGSTVQLLRNDGATAFTSIPVPFHGWPFGAVAWGDLDGDGDPDVVETGRADDLAAWQNGKGAVAVWRNNGPSGFASVPTSLPGLEAGTVSWLDLDADGDMDVLLTGRERLQGPMAVVGENVGGVLMAGGPSGIGGLLSGTVCVGDLGGDGLPDVVAMGQDAKGGMVSCIGNNLGGLRFDCRADALPLVMDGAVAAADMAGDGDLAGCDPWPRHSAGLPQRHDRAAWHRRRDMLVVADDRCAEHDQLHAGGLAADGPLVPPGLDGLHGVRGL